MAFYLGLGFRGCAVYCYPEAAVLLIPDWCLYESPKIFLSTDFLEMPLYGACTGAHCGQTTP